MQRAITSGANGIITGNSDALLKASQIYESPTMTRRSFIIGHRGIPTLAPENTMASYKMAVEQYGANMVETDVYLTKDGQAIILHDNTFARTTDIETTKALDESVFSAGGTTRTKCAPSHLTLEEIKKLDAGIKFSSAFAGERIPTLDELLQYVKEKNVTLVLDAAYDAGSNYLTYDSFIRNANARGLSLWGWTYDNASSYAWAIDHESLFQNS